MLGLRDARQRELRCVQDRIRKRALLVHGRNGRKIEKTRFLGCEAFSITSQKDANGHQKGQAQFVDGYLSLLELH